MKKAIFLKIIFLISLLFLFTGCVERYVSRGFIDNTADWKARSGGSRSGTSKDATELVNFEKESIRIIIKPCNYLEDMRQNDKDFTITGSIAIYYKNQKELFFIPKNSFITIDKNIINPTKVATSNEINHYNDCINLLWKDSNEIKIKGREKFNKYNKNHFYEVEFSLLFKVKPPSVEKNFKLNLGSMFIDGKEIKIPEITFKEGIHFVGFLM